MQKQKDTQFRDISYNAKMVDRAVRCAACSTDPDREISCYVRYDRKLSCLLSTDPMSPRRYEGSSRFSRRCVRFRFTFSMARKFLLGAR